MCRTSTLFIHRRTALSLSFSLTFPLGLAHTLCFIPPALVVTHFLPPRIRAFHYPCLFFYLLPTIHSILTRSAALVSHFYVYLPLIQSIFYTRRSLSLIDAVSSLVYIAEKHVAHSCARAFVLFPQLNARGEYNCSLGLRARLKRCLAAFVYVSFDSADRPELSSHTTILYIQVYLALSR